MAQNQRDAQNEPLTIADLKPDPKNARRRTPRSSAMLVNSLHEVGAARSIVIDETGNILAGNGTVEAAAEAGIERVQVVDADGETIVAVRRTGLTAKQKKRLALFDNRTAELAEWDLPALGDLEAIDVKGLWNDEELQSLTLSHLSFTPSVSGVGSHNVTGEGIEETRKELEARIKAELALKPMLCPYCSREFYVNEDNSK